MDGIVEEGKKKPKKNIDITLWGVWGRGRAGPITPEVFTSTGLPAVSTPVLRALAGKPGAAKKALAELDSAASVDVSDSLGKGSIPRVTPGVHLEVFSRPWSGSVSGQRESYFPFCRVNCDSFEGSFLIVFMVNPY